jgi:branched-chain amino acid transport system ATP-binding protein
MPDGIMPWLVKLYENITYSSQKATERQPELEMQSVLEIMGEGLNHSLVLTDCHSPENAYSPGLDGEGKEILEIEDVCVYFGGVHAVEHVSFSIKQGEILAIIGPNGAGKTTLLNAITRLIPITSGSIKYHGEEISHLKTHEIALRKVVRTFQHTSVFPGLTTRHNLILGHNALEPSDLITNILRTKDWARTEKEIQTKIDEILRFTHLDRYADTGSTNLPYGDQRLLELGIALAGNPALLLLDEPAAGMNPAEVEALMGLIRRIRDSGITIAVVEHDMKLIMGISDRILVLYHGEQLAIGTPTEICQNEKVISAYLGRQYADAPTL